MKKAPALLAVALLSFTLVSAFAPLVFAFDWKDDFNYETLQELTNAGWIYNGGGAIFITPGSVSMYSTGLAPSNPSALISYRSLPQQMDEFYVEAGILRAGIVIVLTQMHSFSISFVSEGEMGPEPGRYVFRADDQTPFQINVPNWNERASHALTLQKNGKTLSVYADGVLMGKYTESDNALDGLSEISLGGGGSIYDYVSVSGTPSGSSSIQPLYFLIPLVAVAVVVLLLLAFAFTRRRDKLIKSDAPSLYCCLHPTYWEEHLTKSKFRMTESSVQGGVIEFVAK